MSVQMAEEILKRNITAQDHETMVKEYMDKVVIKIDQQYFQTLCACFF